MARLDYDRAARTYDQGRAWPLEAFGQWRAALAEFLPALPGGPIVDVGSGTGIWLDALATWFGVRVVGIEPSSGMLAASGRKRLSALASVVAGDAQAIPLRDRSCEAAWLSTVIHHIPDLIACAAELHRVVWPGGLVFVRSSFPGRHDDIPLFRFFPGAQRIAMSFPTVETTVGTFAAAGFSYECLRRVYERRDSNPARMVERVRAMRQADSTLAPLSDEEFAAGMAHLEQAAATMSGVPPTGLDLLVLQKQSQPGP